MVLGFFSKSALKEVLEKKEIFNQNKKSILYAVGSTREWSKLPYRHKIGEMFGPWVSSLGPLKPSLLQKKKFL